MVSTPHTMAEVLSKETESLIVEPQNLEFKNKVAIQWFIHTLHINDGDS
jgi:hypothetical protein